VNLVGAELVNDPQEALGSSKISLDPQDIYCYCFGTPAGASPSADYDNSVYDCIHSVIEKDDMVVKFPISVMGFGRYGTVDSAKEGMSKDRMLELLEIRRPETYDSFMNGGDPDKFVHLKLDSEAIKSGGMNFVYDPDSYLPDNQADFLDSVFAQMGEEYEGRGEDARSDYYSGYYQEAFELMMACYGESKLDVSSVMQAKSIVPSTLVMYLTYVLYKANKENITDINPVVESTFNALASQIEDENGDLVNEYRSVSKPYKALRTLLFAQNDDEDISVSEDGILMKYHLKKQMKPLKTNGIVLKYVRKLNGKLFANVINEVYGPTAAEPELIERLGSEDVSDAMAFILTNVYFGNDRQSEGIPPLSFENEQFKHMATFLGNSGRYRTNHEALILISWLRAGDQHYDDYALPDEAQSTGYRRVFIESPDGVDVMGVIRDKDGNEVARFENDEMLSRNDDWIGITTCDNGNWLRLPLNKDYKIDLSVSKDSKIDLRVDDYSIIEGETLRTVRNDNRYNWSGLSLKTDDALTMNIPAAVKADDKYDVTSAYYNMDIRRATDPDKGKVDPPMPVIFDSGIPAVKNLTVKASGNTVTVKWKKLKFKQRRKYNRTEIQYSTDKSFSRAKTVTKEVTKYRTSCKLKKLKKGTKYYVRVRNIKYSHNKKYVGRWSAVKRLP
jgi:hypothetical protein